MRALSKFAKDNSLSLVLFGLFAVVLAGMSLAGVREENAELSSHGQPPLAYFEYVASGSFVEAVFENWESEFLQMGALVVLTIWFTQKGSKDSKKIRGRDEADAPSRYSIIQSSWSDKPKAIRKVLYANSLSIALFGLFFLAFFLHMAGGVATYNEEALLHGEQSLSAWQYLTTARFWFESLQNWQSEFLAVGVLIVLTIFLRQRHSPESKPVEAPNPKTGE